MYQLSEKLQAAVILCYQPPGMALDPETLVAVTGDDALWELRRLHMAHMCRTGAPGTGFRVRCFVFAASEEPLTPEAALGGT
ncbi:hypothetical protein MNEG_3679 [Monoraphidium neglectum]|uniref:Uncharacterized protein n=1 Tax=Monoraphidium neglectum TaxID=145388 RepID=A0A0D2K0X7_9CHLO|nr:hypothetical protein MNEG_3679 [Monoraphidium neglectum]KIZ04278.1 hypothetical protein MNEG_3679 [Monoraphidium neglectum]|eukprot:XP_013903297.1 hypothetical protein MNEG_3679 [Monoraphidium neglectum]